MGECLVVDDSTGIDFLHLLILLLTLGPFNLLTVYCCSSSGVSAGVVLQVHCREVVKLFCLPVTYSFVLAISAFFLSFLICILLAGLDAHRLTGVGLLDGQKWFSY
jgi:hypothetical protein